MRQRYLAQWLIYNGIGWHGCARWTRHPWQRF